MIIFFFIIYVFCVEASIFVYTRLAGHKITEKDKTELSKFVDIYLQTWCL